MSESLLVILGNPLPLSLTLPNGASGLFPQAIVYDSADGVVAGGPFDLTEVGTTGRYTLDGPTPIAVEAFTAHYIVYTDSDHLIEATTFGRSQDSFTVEDVVGVKADVLVDLIWDEVNRGADHNIKDSTGKQQRQASGGVGSEDVVSAGANTIELAATEPAIDDFHFNRYIAIVAGLGVGQIRIIKAYVGATRVATVDRPWDIEPDATSDYLLLLSATTNLDSVLSTGGSGPWTTGAGASPAAVAAAVWAELVPGAFGPGSAGARVGELTAARLAELDPANMPGDLDAVLALLADAGLQGASVDPDIL